MGQSHSIRMLQMLILGILLLCNTVYGLKDEITKNYELINNGAPKSILRKEKVRYDPETGFPTAFYNLNYQSHGDSPKSITDHFIVHNRELLGLDSDYDLSDLHHYKVLNTQAGGTVRYHQVYKGVPVYESDLVVTYNTKKQITFVTSTYKNGIQLESNDVSPNFNAKEVIGQAQNKMSDDLTYKDAELSVVYQKKGPSLLVWKLNAIQRDYKEEMEILMDAKTGKFLQKRKRFGRFTKRGYEQEQKEKNDQTHMESQDTSKAPTQSQSLRFVHKTVTRQRKTQESLGFISKLNSWKKIVKGIIIQIIKSMFLYAYDLFDTTSMPSAMPTGSIMPSTVPSRKPTSAPTTSFEPSNSFAPSKSPNVATARGYVFDPDPIATSDANYGDRGFIDDGDKNSPQLQAQLIDVALEEITFDGNQYYLKGPWVEIVDTEFPKKGLFKQPSPDFYFSRDDDGFEAVNCYYHVDKIMRYINVDLSIPCRPYRYDGPIRVDPHGFSGDDNSHYVMITQELAYGEGNVDDGEDASVIVHELGHGIHDWLTQGGLSITEGLSEGFSDYIAASYGRESALKHLSRDNPKMQWLMRWDGHNEFWSGRTTASTAKYTDGLKGNPHTDGQIWASCNMRIFEAIGKEKTDKIVLVGMSMTNFFSNQLDATKAVVQAAENFGYSSQDMKIIKNIYVGCGYDVTDDICGDGIKGQFEECDNDDFGDASCASSSCRNGRPVCRKDCTLDYSTCLPDPDEFFYEVFISTDNFYSETSWDIKDSSNEILNSGGPFLSTETFSEHGCLRRGQCYTFTLYDEFSDGICCEYGIGDYNVIVDGIQIENTDPDFDAAFVSHVIGDCI